MLINHHQYAYSVHVQIILFLPYNKCISVLYIILLDTRILCILKTLEIKSHELQDANLKALKELEIGFWSLKVLDF